MTARNDITGDAIKTKPNSKKFQENYEKIFGDKRVERGRYKQDPETKKFIHVSEYYAKYPQKRFGQAPMFFCNHFEPFVSPVTGEVIQNKREHLYDLHSTGSRVYEGRDQEEKEASRHRQYQEQRFEQDIDHTLRQTQHDIEHGYLKPGEQNG